MRSLLTLLFLYSIHALPVVAGSGATLDEGLLPVDTSEFPAEVIDEVLVPNPAELFAILDKLGTPDWKSCLRSGVEGNHGGDRTALALRFGATIAEGFIAVQAEDPNAVLDLGQAILELSRDLGLEDAVFPHCQAIIEACEKKHWQRVRQELDLTHRTVRLSMEQIRDEDLAQCVSIGGWLRGTEALTEIIGSAYNSDKAEILNQPDLAAYFVQQLNQMPANPALEEIRIGLIQVQSLMRAHPADSIPSETVTKIHQICATMVASIIPPAAPIAPPAPAQP